MTATERNVLNNSEWPGGVAYAPPASRGGGGPPIQSFRNFRKTLYGPTNSGSPRDKDPRHPGPPGSVTLITRAVQWIVVGRGGCAGTLVPSGGPREAPIQGFRNFRKSLYDITKIDSKLEEKLISPPEIF